METKLSPEMLQALDILLAHGLLQMRDEGEVIQDGVSLQLCHGHPAPVLRLHVKFGGLRFRVHLFADKTKIVEVLPSEKALDDITNLPSADVLAHRLSELASRRG